MVKSNEPIDPKDPHLVKPVAPAQKWEHTGSNYDELVSRIVGMMTIRGEREVARNAMRMTFREIKLIQMRKNKNIANMSKSNVIIKNPITVIHEAVANCTPLLLLQSVPRGGILYKVPAPPVSSSIATHAAVKFILDAAKEKPRDQRIWISMGNEFILASQNQGKAVKFKVEIHKQCEENRAYANYRTH
nr:SJCHGC04466 protein [Schistosoma japonicum]